MFPAMDYNHDSYDTFTTTGVSLNEFVKSFMSLSDPKSEANLRKTHIMANDGEDVLGALAILGLNADKRKHKLILKDIIERARLRGFSEKGRLALEAESMALMAQLCTEWRTDEELWDLAKFFLMGLRFSEMVVLVCDYDWEQNKPVADFLANMAGTLVRSYSHNLSPSGSSCIEVSNRFISRLLHAVMTGSAGSVTLKDFLGNSAVVSYMMREDFDAEREIMEKLKLPLIGVRWTWYSAFFKHIPATLFQESKVFLMKKEHMCVDCKFTYECAFRVIGNENLHAFFKQKHPITHESRFKLAVKHYRRFPPAFMIQTLAEHAVDLPVSTDLFLEQDSNDKTPSVLFLLCEKSMGKILRTIICTRTRRELKLDLSTDENQAYMTVARQLVQHEESTGIMTEEQAGICFAYIDKVYA